MNEPKFDVAIVGYGPVGVITANYLGMYGIKTVVFERETDVYHLPRAIGFNHEIMRIFQQLGLHEQIESVSTPVEGVEFLDRSHQLLFEIELSKTCLTHGFSPNYVFYQPDLETKLREGTKRFDSVTLNLGHAVESITQDCQNATITVRDLQSDRLYQVKSKYVLGCDGARSITRQLAGIELEDFGFHQRQLVVDTLLTAKADLPSKVQQLCDTRRPGVFVHSTNNHRRWEFVLDKAETKAEMEQPAKVRELLATYWIDPNKLKVIRAVVYHFHSLIALRWRSDRIFVVGDAAHQMPPILGQGMCSGIRDAQNLCWKLDLVLKGVASDRLLDTYQTERLPHVREIVTVATRAFKVFKTRNPIFALFRDTVMRLVQKFAAKSKLQNVGSDMPPLTQGILASSLNGDRAVAVGQMFIQPQVLDKHGEIVLLDRILGNSWAILGINADYLSFVSLESQAFLTDLSTKFICVAKGDDDSIDCSYPMESVQDNSGQISDWLTKLQCEIVIIRPDRYIFGVGKRHELESLVNQLKSFFTKDYGLAVDLQLSTNPLKEQQPFASTTNH